MTLCFGIALYPQRLAVAGVLLLIGTHQSSLHGGWAMIH